MARTTAEQETMVEMMTVTQRKPSSVFRSRRGMAMVAVMLVMLGILALSSMTIISMVNYNLRASRRRVDQVEALNLADAGVDLALGYLQAQPLPPDNLTLHPMTNFYGTNGTINAPFGQAGTQLVVAIHPDAANPGPTQKHYLVESKAIMPGGIQRIVRAYVAQISFGKYAFFADIDSSGFWDYQNHFEGPFHSNASDNIGSTFLWKSTGGTTPIFTYTGDDAFSSSYDVTWWKNNTNSVGAPTTDADFNIIASGGLQSMKNYGFMKDANGNYILDSSGNKVPKSSKIPLPNTDYLQAYVALGLTPPASASSLPSSRPSTLGATVTAAGGIYIHGSSAITLSESGAGVQVFNVVTTSGSTVVTQTITVNQSSNSTTMVSTTKVSGIITIGPTTTSYASALNGMVFSDDNITALSGTIADNVTDASGNITKRNMWTIATDTGASKDMTLSDSIKYKTGRNLNAAQATDTNYNTKAGTLGLLSRNIILKDGAPAQVEFDALMFCTGSYKAANPHNPAGSLNGVMTAIGGVIVKTSGIFAYANSDGTLSSGWNEQYHYDSRMADYPPPFFPTTGNHYAVQSYQMVNSTLP